MNKKITTIIVLITIIGIGGFLYWKDEKRKEDWNKEKKKVIDIYIEDKNYSDEIKSSIDNYYNIYLNKWVNDNTPEEFIKNYEEFIKDYKLIIDTIPSAMYSDKLYLRSPDTRFVRYFYVKNNAEKEYIRIREPRDMEETAYEGYHYDFHLKKGHYQIQYLTNGQVFEIGKENKIYYSYFMNGTEAPISDSLYSYHLNGQKRYKVIEELDFKNYFPYKDEYYGSNPESIEFSSRIVDREEYDEQGNIKFTGTDYLGKSIRYENNSPIVVSYSLFGGEIIRDTNLVVFDYVNDYEENSETFFDDFYNQNPQLDVVLGSDKYLITTVGVLRSYYHECMECVNCNFYVVQGHLKEWVEGSDIKTCPTCQGTGNLADSHKSMSGYNKCPSCVGKGYYIPSKFTRKVYDYLYYLCNNEIKFVINLENGESLYLYSGDGWSEYHLKDNEQYRFKKDYNDKYLSRIKETIDKI